MKIVVAPFTGAHPSTANRIGEVGLQVEPSLEHMDFSQFPTSNNPWGVAIGLAILVPFVIFGIVFT